MFRNGMALLLFMEVVVNSLGITRLLPSIIYREPRDWALLTARAAITALEFISAASLRSGRASGPLFASRVLLASAILLTLEIGFRLAPTNLDPTFRWWVVGAYWMYTLVAGAGLRRSRPR